MMDSSNVYVVIIAAVLLCFCDVVPIGKDG
jgi:hypothetical protein